MDLGVDNSYILYAAGVFLSVVTLLYFGSSFIFSLSPATKSVMLAGITAMLFVAAVSTSKTLVDTVFYVLSAASYMVFLGYSLLKFRPGQSVVLGLLAVSSGLLLAAGYLVSEKHLMLGWSTGKKVLAGTALVVVLVLAVDIGGSQPTYTLELNDTVNITGPGNAMVGVLEVRNSFFMPRELDIPRYDGCLYEPERRSVYIDLERPDRGIIDGGVEKDLELSVNRIPRSEEEVDVKGVYEIRHMEECPDDLSGKTLVIVEEPSYD